MSTENEVEKRGPGRPPKVEQESEMMQLIRAMGEQNKEQLIALAAELRKPTEMEQKKLDEERTQAIKRAEMAIAVAKAQEQADTILQASCTHENGHGVTQFIGQPNSDGYVVPWCARCHVKLPPIKCTPAEIQNGFLMQQRGGVNRQSLENLARARAN